MLDVKKCVKNCMEKYGLSELEATRIATTDSSILSVDELKYKYDNLSIGEGYPDWITPEEHLKMCYAVVWRKYNRGFFWYNSCEDVALDLFLYSSVHLHNYTDKFQLNGLLLCRLKNIIRDYSQDLTICPVYCETDDNFDDEMFEKNSFARMGIYTKDDTSKVELINAISSIRNEKIRGILLLCGYFIADISEFLPLLVTYYEGCTDRIKNKIYDLGKDDFDFCFSVNKSVDNSTKVSITVGKILKIFGYRDKAYLFTDLLPYMKDMGFAQ